MMQCLVLLFGSLVPDAVILVEVIETTGNAWSKAVTAKVFLYRPIFFVGI